MNVGKEQNRPIWEIENTNPELVESLKASLSEVIDPEIGFNILQLGLVRNVAISEGKVALSMILTTPFCPYGPTILESARQKAEDALALPVEIDLGHEMWDFSMMEEGLGADWGIF